MNWFAPPSQEFAKRLDTAPLPALRATLDALRIMGENPDRADANSLSEIVLRDPLMCARLLGSCSKSSSPLASPPKTVTAALLLTGTDRFFESTLDVPCLEDALADHPHAIDAAMHCVERSWDAARLAVTFAIHRQDEDAEVEQQAALLGDVTELFAWTLFPQEMLSIASRQRAMPKLRSAQAQLDVLGIDLQDTRDSWLEARGINEAVRALLLPTQTSSAARSVRLALRTARHLQHGWHDAGLPDDFAETGALLHITPHATAQLVRQAIV